MCFFFFVKFKAKNANSWCLVFRVLDFDHVYVVKKKTQ